MNRASRTKKFSLTIQQAVQKAEGDLRLENGLVSEWGNALFLRVKNGELNLHDSKREIDKYVQTHLILNKEIAYKAMQDLVNSE